MVQDLTNFILVIRKKILFILLLFIVSSLQAEVIDGPANVRDKPGGFVILSLNNGVRISITGRNHNWYKIIIFGNINKENFHNGKIFKNSILKDSYGRRIGKFTKEFITNDYIEENEKVKLVIELYTYKNNIEESSIIEKKIATLINKDSFDILNIQKMKYLNARVIDDIGKNKVMIVYDQEQSPLTPLVRLMIFHDEKNIFAIIGNKKFKNYKFNFVNCENLDNDLTLYYLNIAFYQNRDVFKKYLKIFLNTGG